MLDGERRSGEGNLRFDFFEALFARRKNVFRYCRKGSRPFS